jgi:hypothetical protein
LPGLAPHIRLQYHFPVGQIHTEMIQKGF